MSLSISVAVVIPFSLAAFFIGVMVMSPDNDTQRMKNKCEDDPRASWTCRTVHYVGESSKPETARSCVCEDAGTP